jgi:hypothetical protein
VALVHYAKTVYDVQPTRTRVMLAGISMLHGLVPSGTHTQLSDLAAGSNGPPKSRSWQRRSQQRRLVILFLATDQLHYTASYTAHGTKWEVS